MSRIPVEELIKHYEYDPSQVERVNERIRAAPQIVIVDYDPTWPQRYEEHRDRIVNAIGDQLVTIDHVGSTSVPGLPAKPMIDIDLTVRDVLDESSYAPALEKAGYSFLFREPRWHQHRFMVSETDYMFPVQLHIWGDDQVEAERHKIMRDWLRGHLEDMKVYADVKRQAAEQSAKTGEKMMQYNSRKEWIIKEILGRAFKSLGYI